jgi:hypothetical protein
MPIKKKAAAAAAAATDAATAGTIAEARRLADADDDAGALDRLGEARARLEAARGSEIERRWLSFEMACCQVFLDQPKQALALLAESAALEPTLRVLAYADPRLASIRRLPAFVSATAGRGGPVLPQFPRGPERRVMMFDEPAAPLLMRSMRAHGWKGKQRITFAYSTSGGKDSYPSETQLPKPVMDCVMEHMTWFVNDVIVAGGNMDATRLAQPDDNDDINYEMRYHAGVPYDEVLAEWRKEGARVLHGVDYSVHVGTLEATVKLLAGASGAATAAALIEVIARHPEPIVDAMSVAESIAAARGWDLLPDVAAAVNTRLARESELDPSMLLYAVEHRARLGKLGRTGASLAGRLAVREKKTDVALYFK